MDQEGTEPQVLAVAGCLFEVSFVEREGGQWTWVGDQPEVSPMGEAVRGDRRHFRFRAEAPAAAAGSVSLRFRSMTEARGMTMRMVVVPVAPERQGDE
jgi:hypothetical protein